MWLKSILPDTIHYSRFIFINSLANKKGSGFLGPEP